LNNGQVELARKGGGCGEAGGGNQGSCDHACKVPACVASGKSGRGLICGTIYDQLIVNDLVKDAIVAFSYPAFCLMRIL
jgi:hypothetical protein